MAVVGARRSTRGIVLPLLTFPGTVPYVQALPSESGEEYRRKNCEHHFRLRLSIRYASC